MGTPTVATVQFFGGESFLPLLPLIYGAEQGSEHPIGRAIVRYCEEERGFEPVALPSLFLAIPGAGVEAHWGEMTKVLVGTERLLQERGVVLHPAQEYARERTIIHAAVNGVHVATVALQDEVRTEAASTLHWLRERSLDLWLVSGDQAQTCEAVAKRLDIPTVRARVLPDEKASVVATLQKEAMRKVVFMGDGVNDAIALATADLGIAVCGSDVAQDAADVVLLREGISGLSTLIDLSVKVHRSIVFNFCWAFVYNFFGLLIAAGVFTPVGFTLPPALAGLGEIFSVMPVIVSSLLLKLYRKPLLEEEQAFTVIVDDDDHDDDPHYELEEIDL